MFRQKAAGARHGWQGAGREWERGPGCVLAVTAHSVAPLLPSRRFPGGTDRSQGQFFSLSIPRVTSVTAGPGSADPAGMAAPGNSPTRESWTPEKTHSEPGQWGLHSPGTPRQPPELSFWGTPVPVRPPVMPSIVGGTQPLRGAQRGGAEPRRPHPAAHKPQCSPMYTDSSLYLPRNQPENSYKRITRSNSKWQHFTRDGGRRERRVEGKQAASPTALGCPPFPHPAGRDPLPAARGHRPGPGTGGSRCPQPPGKHRAWDSSSLVPPCL